MRVRRHMHLTAFGAVQVLPRRFAPRNDIWSFNGSVESYFN